MRKAILTIIISSLIILPLSSSAFTRYKFNAKPLDTESNLYYYGQRYYDPNIGRFTQPDPVANYLTNPEQMKKATGMDLQKFLENPQNLNSYSYTINNPVKYTDPNGEYIDEVFDPMFITQSYEYMQTRQTTWSQIAFGADLALLVIPFVPAIANKAVGIFEGLKVAKIFRDAESLKTAKDIANFSNKEQLLENYIKHKGNLGDISLKEFSNKAQDLFKRYINSDKNILSGLKGEDNVLFDKQTNEFSVVTQNNVIKTYFVPNVKDKLQYFLRNIDKLKE